MPLTNDTDHFSYQFNIPLDIWPLLTHVSITNICIPRSWYIIQSSPLNTFILYENSVAIPLSIPMGDYTNIELFQELQNVLNAGSLNSVTYTVLEQNTTMLGQTPVPDLNSIYITSSNPLINSQLFFSNQTLLDPILGFNEGFNNFISGVLYGGVYNLAAENDIFLTSDCVRSIINDSPISNQTLCTIKAGNTPPYCYITEDYDMIANMKILSKIGQLFTFELANEQSLNSFYLNEINISFTICFFTYTPYENQLQKIIDLLEIMALRPH